ncbi:MAG: alpha/beta fold hydrolase [Acidobacteriaceae bacterium]
MARLPEELQRSTDKSGDSRRQRERNANLSQPRTDQLAHAEVVSGRWLVKAILLVLAIAGVALYLTVCLLFYQGQWQFTFFPPRQTPPSVASVAAKTSLPIADIRFDTTEEGVEQLDGWWIPAAGPANGPSPPQAAADARVVVLFCPNGHTDLPQNVDALQAFHALGAAVFAFDYQGFGASRKGHPSQQKAYANGVAAMNYLTGIRHIPPDRVVVYGARLGAAVAAHVAQQSPHIAGLILEDPQPSLAAEVKREQHIHLLPMWLVFQDRFRISDIVPSLKIPKLILLTNAMREYESGAVTVYDEAQAPRRKVAIRGQSDQPVYLQPEWRTAVGNFLNTVGTEPAGPATSRVP